MITVSRFIAKTTLLLAYAKAILLLAYLNNETNTLGVKTMNVSDIVNLANANSKVFKKRDVNQALLTVIETIDTDDRETVQALATLYLKLFKKTKSTKKNKTPLEVLSHFVGINDVRYYLNTIDVRAERMVASDGHRLAMYSGKHDLEDGIYDAKALIRLAPLESYPDFERVFNQTILETRTDLEPDERTVFRGSEDSYEIVNYKDIWFKSDYIDTVIRVLTDEPYEVSICELCLIVKQGNFKFVIMSTRV